MPEIRYTDIERHLKQSKGKLPPVCLIHGEEALCKTALDAVLDALVPRAERDMTYDPVADDNVHEAIERVNTFSLLSGGKIVGLPDSRVFYGKQPDKALPEKARDAWEADERKKAARYFTAFLGAAGLTLDDVADPAKREKSLKIDPETIGNGEWLTDMIAYCADNSLSPAPPQDAAADLLQAVEKGFPAGNHLIITADLVDRRRKLYTVLRDGGLVVDCSVPQGARKADRMAREAILNERMQTLLSKSGKTLDRPAYQAICEKTGFDLRTFSANLEKLISYAGNRNRITAEDVDAVLTRTRQDPIYELTNAVAERNLPDALFYLDSLLFEGLFPLQILAGMVNQVRKLLLIRDFIESPEGRVWTPGMNYDQFQQRVLPVLRRQDQSLTGTLTAWDDLLSGQEPEKQGKGKKKKSPASDLLLTGPGRSPYPLYLLMVRAGKFSRAELVDAMIRLGRADLQLKTSGQAPRRVLEEVLLRICRPAGV